MRLVLLALILVMFAGCASSAARPTSVEYEGTRHALTGLASWYGERFQGRSTASGEPFDLNDMTAAHRTLPFGTVVRVVDPDTRKSVVVRINDRGPFTKGRVIDLSRAAAEDLGMIQAGVIKVYLEVLRWP